jgi:hypothetical protein
MAASREANRQYSSTTTFVKPCKGIYFLAFVLPDTWVQLLRQTP